MNNENSLKSVLSHKQKTSKDKNAKNKMSLKERKAARRAKQLIGKNKGRWLEEERREYYVFLRIYSQFFVNKDYRRNDKVYRMMADFIKSRTPDQCRTHHQKLQFKYFKLTKIIDVLKDQFGTIDYDEIIKKCQTTSTNVNTPTTTTERDATFNECNYDLFVSQNEESNNNYEIPQKQPSQLSFAYHISISHQNFDLFDNSLPALSDMLE